MLSRFQLASLPLPTLVLHRSLSVYAHTPAPSNTSTRLTRVTRQPRVLLDETGRARRPLPPLTLAGNAATHEEGESRWLWSGNTQLTCPSRAVPIKTTKKRVVARKSPKAAPCQPVASTSKALLAEDGSEGIEEMLEQVEGAAEVGEEELTSTPSPLEAQLRRDLARYPQAILLTQVGSFFEVRRITMSARLGLTS